MTQHTDDLATLAYAVAAMSAVLARVDREYGTLDREKRISDALHAMAKRLEAGK